MGSRFVACVLVGVLRAVLVLFGPRLVLFAFALGGGRAAAVPIVDDLAGNETVGQSRDDKSKHHHRIARLLDRSENARHGTGCQQENGHSRQLARAALTVVGSRLNQLHNNNNKMKRQQQQ